MADDFSTGVPLHLYLDLEQGHVADLIAVSEASIAFARGVKELAFLLDPSLEIEVGMKPPSDGSLWQNTWLRARGEYQKRRELYLAAAASVVWFMQPPFERARDQVWEPVLDKYLPDATDEEKQRVQRIATTSVASGHREDAFRALSKDQGIYGVAATPEKKKPPREAIIPRAEFDARAGVPLGDLDEDAVPDKVEIRPLRVSLISPVLDDSARRWKFATRDGEFGASIRDRAFLARVARGELGIPLRAGIVMDIQLETKERHTDGIFWQVVERNVVRVDNVAAPPPPAQRQLFGDEGE